MHLWQWLGRRDRDYVALRRACRAAIVMPGLFALGDKVFVNADIATFGAFGAFAMLLLVDFGGPMAQRLQAQAALAFVGAILICLGTLASATPWLAAIGMAVVGFGVLFAGVVSSTLATASTALLLAFILPVSVPAPVSAVPERLAGWGLAAVSGLIAIALLWPAPARDRLRPPPSPLARRWPAGSGPRSPSCSAAQIRASPPTGSAPSQRRMMPPRRCGVRFWPRRTSRVVCAPPLARSRGWWPRSAG
jgi:hypothetical protein